MKTTPLCRVAFVAGWLLALGLAALAQDFQQTYRLGPGGVVNVHSVSGNVKVTGYEGDAIVVTGYKEGRGGSNYVDLVTIEDNSTSNRVEVRDRYPERCRNCNVSVRFEVRVPRQLALRYEGFGSVSGDVDVTGVTGDLKAKSVSGNVRVSSVAGTVNASSVSGNVEVGEVAGTVSAKSVSGNVQVEIVRLESSGNMDFSSVSGNVQVRVPGSLDADLELSSMSGEIRTDFPLQIEKAEFGPQRSARGRVGSGARRLKMSSVSGSVHLLQNK